MSASSPELDALLASYPRTRPALPDRQAAIYEREYVGNRDGASLASRMAQRLERWMHRRIAELEGGPVLELGAGTLNHLAYERGAGADFAYDAVEPFEAMYRDRPERARVRDLFASIRDVPADRRYRRILSVAVLEHVLDLPDLLRRSASLLDDDGVFQAGIPAEGSFAWGTAWRLSTGIGYRLRTGMPYKNVMRHEHVNSAREILRLARAFFPAVSVRYFPLPFFHGAFYAYLEARRRQGDAPLPSVPR